ncbi:hypothetical protein LIER_09677 [Lithospermum erythrorhizon]|uniref:Uncharacterized protein n=1 Tax=Lithospermum erythrorhizon TaxID=34254 RepID=A0AAV3PI75_LITER
MREIEGGKSIDRFTIVVAFETCSIQKFFQALDPLAWKELCSSIDCWATKVGVARWFSINVEPLKRKLLMRVIWRVMKSNEGGTDEP